MQIIKPSNVNAKSHGNALNALAVEKRAYPLYFYIDSGKDLANSIALPANESNVVITIETGHGLSTGDYFRLAPTDLTDLTDEVLVVLANLSATSLKVGRAQLGTVAESHVKTSSVYFRQEGLTNTQLGAGTAVIAESRIAIDLADPSFYQCTLELILTCDQDYSAKSITLYYALSGEEDIPMGASTLEARLTNTAESLVGTFPNNATLNYKTEQFIVDARYLYIWVIGQTDLDDAQTTAKILLNTV